MAQGPESDTAPILGKVELTKITGAGAGVGVEAMPLPVRLMFPLTVPLMLRVAVSAASVAGVKVTRMVQVFVGARV